MVAPPNPPLRTIDGTQKEGAHNTTYLLRTQELKAPSHESETYDSLGLPERRERRERRERAATKGEEGKEGESSKEGNSFKPQPTLM